MAYSSFLKNKPRLLIRGVDAGNTLVAFDPWSVLLVSKWLPFGLICSVRRQHLALFEGNCDSSPTDSPKGIATTDEQTKNPAAIVVKRNIAPTKITQR